MPAYSDQPPETHEPTCPALEAVIVPRAKDIGGFAVRRALPAIERRMIGPFAFLDQMGPADFPEGQGIDVRPHPHIGLATVTYLFDGAIMHRDTLGSVQEIRPGALNLMTAGRGIAHSERTGPQTRAAGHRLSGLQAWFALPKTHEEMDPAFLHVSETELPLVQDHGVSARVIFGAYAGARSPATFPWEVGYVDLSLSPGARAPFHAEHEERGLYVINGSIEVAGDTFAPGRLLVFREGDAITLTGGPDGARLVLISGAAMDGPRHLWWNFVSSSKDRIEEAKIAWRTGQFGQVPMETEFIPLPEH